MTKTELLTRLISESIAQGWTVPRLAIALNRPPRTVYGWFQYRACPTRAAVKQWAALLSISIPTEVFTKEFINTGSFSAIPLVQALFAIADKQSMSNGEIARRARIEPATVANLRAGRGYPLLSTVEAFAAAVNHKLTLSPNDQ